MFFTRIGKCSSFVLHSDWITNWLADLFRWRLLSSVRLLRFEWSAQQSVRWSVTLENILKKLTWTHTWPLPIMTSHRWAVNVISFIINSIMMLTLVLSSPGRGWRTRVLWSGLHWRVQDEGSRCIGHTYDLYHHDDDLQHHAVSFRGIIMNLSSIFPLLSLH